jgi:hypothetical protein
MQGIEIPIGAPLGQLDKDLKGAQSKLKGFANNTNSTLGKLSSGTTAVMGTVAASIAGAFSVQAIIGFTKEVFAATAQFQKFEAVLGNTLGSSALASLKLKEIQDFAAKTPFSVDELTGSFVKLANQGFKPTVNQMRMLGDLAASTGKSFDQLAEAVIDAQVGEFERLKEFGIRAQDAGDKVIFTFKGVQTTVDKSSESIRKYITDLGNAEGVMGATAVISATLGGKISNLGDSWNQMLISVGSNTQGVFSSAISIISSAIDGVTEFNRELEVASKFKIEGSLFQQLAKFAGKGAGVGGLGAIFTTKDLKIEAIQSIESGVNGIVSATISGAKSATDFGNAIAKLKAEGDKLLKSGGGGDKNVANAFKAIYQDGIKALQDGRKAFQAELNKPADKGFGKTKKEKTKDGIDFEQIKIDANAFAGKLEILKISNSVAQAIEKESQKQDEFNKGLEEAVLITERFQSEIFGQKLAAPVENLTTNILPQLQTSFQTFFDDILMHGKLSFESLGKSILNTFASVLASEATQGVLNLLGSKGGKTEKGGGLLGGIGTLLGIGGKVAGAVGGTAATGGTAALATGTAATGGALLPILAGVAAVASIASLFKKKKQAPIPQASSTISTSAAGSAQDFGGGRVVFEISGTNLIGVLNRAGAKLQRFGP